MTLATEWLGTVRYGEAFALQEQAVIDRRAGRTGDRLLLLEHPAVVTLGRNSHEAHLLTPRAELEARGVDVHEIPRGGDVTYHGPGQLVGYLILDLEPRGRDVDRLLRSIEAALVGAAGELGLAAGTLSGMTGVFMQGSAPPRKLASIGLGLRQWVSWHGFALNVSVDPAGFGDIVPCGLHGVEMTSVAAELGADAPADLAARARRAVERACTEQLG
ncbi:MAG: lipoyl(octanoyl) transferase LipB [Myxococcota bacterium]